MQFLTNLKNTAVQSKKTLIFVVLLAGAVIFYVSTKKPAEVVPKSDIAGASAMKNETLPGSTDDLQLQNAIDNKDNNDFVEAQKNNGTTQPSFTGNETGNDKPPLVIDDPAVDTPVIEKPDENINTVPTIELEQPQPSVPLVQPVVAAPIQVDPQMVENMTKALKGPVFGGAAVVDWGVDATRYEPKVATQSVPTAVASATSEVAGSKIQIPLPGTILYAELISEANSDNPGPVLARVLQGEYTGATLIGQFSVSQEALIITFNRMTVKKTLSGEEINETVAINSSAVDTKYIGTGLATSVDRHLFQKLSIAFVTGFAQGYGDAVSENGTTTIDTGNGTVTTGGSDLNPKEELISAGGQAVSNAGNILQDVYGNRKTTVKVKQGTPIGVLFL